MRFTTRLSMAVAVLALLSRPASLSAQTLADVAKKTAEGRKTTETKGTPAKVYGNDDLKPSSGPAPAPASPATSKPDEAAKPKGDQKGTEQKGAEDEKGETYWRTRMGQAREALRRSQLFRDSLQTRINSLTNDISSRDDAGQRAQLIGDRQTAVSELARVNTEIEQTTKKIADIEEEARQAGVPPGWLR
jgi:hypothetical protein